MTSKKIKNMLVYILVIIVAALVALPFIWMVVSAFKSQRELFAYPPTFFPTEWKWENFTEAASRGSISFWAMFLNSMKIAVPSTLFNVIFSSLAGYAFARLRFPGRDKIFMCFLAAMMVPFVITLIPRFLLFRDLGFYDTYVPLIVPAMFGTPFSIFLTRQFFMTLPDELIEAARIDGASPMSFFRDIVLPLSKTNLAALFVITFIYGWNQYLWPLLIITDVDLGTAVAGIKGMIATGEGTTQWNQVMAAMLLTLIPPVVIVLAMQRAFVRGLVDSEK